MRRFSYEHSNDEPDFSKLRIMHTWGSVSKPGVYAELAEKLSAPVRDFVYAKAQYGWNAAFDGVCDELLTLVKSSEMEPLYDVVLIDEAQDLPAPFFHLVHAACKEPKRLVWAYDELQNLRETAMPTIDQMFGKDVSGNPRVRLGGGNGSPRQDIVLPVCYRNTPWR